MIKKLTGSIICAAMAVLIGTTSVQAVPVLINGGFETANFQGWTRVTNAGIAGNQCDTDWYVSRTDTKCDQGAQTSGVAHTKLSDAVEGEFAAYNSFDGTIAPGATGLNYTIEQDINLGDVAAANLAFSYTLGWDFALNHVPTADRVFTMSFLDVANTLIGNVFIFNLDHRGAMTGFIDWTDESIDVTSMISSFANQTITLVANIFIPETKTGPGSFGLDAVNLNIEASSVAVPSPSMFSIFTLGLLMLIGLGRRAR